jgi:hypothetical protein
VKLTERVAALQRLIEDTIIELEEITPETAPRLAGQLYQELARIRAYRTQSRALVGDLQPRREETHADLVARQQMERKAAREERDAKIVELYQSGMTMLEIAKEMGCSQGPVVGALNRHDIPRRSQGSRKGYNLTKSRERAELIRKRREEGHTLEEIGRELGITRERVRQLCITHEISTDPVLRPEQLEAAKRYAEGIESALMVAEVYGVGVVTLKGWVTRAGYEIKPADTKRKRIPRKEITMERAARAGELYKSGMRIADIAAELDLPAPEMVYRYLHIAQVPCDRLASARRRRNKITIERVSDMPWTAERVDTLKTMWGAGNTAQEIADRLGGVSRSAVLGKVYRLGLEKGEKVQ